LDEVRPVDLWIAIHLINKSIPENNEVAVGVGVVV
jgi:hypothetical protein